MSEVIELPSVFVTSGEWRSLDEEQQLSLRRRLGKAKTLGATLFSGERMAESSDFVDFAEDLELDVAVMPELDTAHRGGSGRWLLHYS